MKVLFVCHGNVGRSQVAEGFFNNLSKHEGVSAGTGADEALEKQRPESNKLKDVPSQRPVKYMQGHGIDVSEKERTQLTSEMLDEADKVVVITEKSSWPDYLQNSDKVVFWDIPDAVGMDDDFTQNVFEQVRLQVEALVRETG